jgi:hypothetical protein
LQCCRVGGGNSAFLYIFFSEKVFLYLDYSIHRTLGFIRGIQSGKILGISEQI